MPQFQQKRATPGLASLKRFPIHLEIAASHGNKDLIATNTKTSSPQQHQGKCFLLDISWKSFIPSSNLASLPRPSTITLHVTTLGHTILLDISNKIPCIVRRIELANIQIFGFSRRQSSRWGKVLAREELQADLCTKNGS